MRRLASLLVAPVVLLTACPLTTFEIDRSSGTAGGGGGGGSSTSGGSAPIAGFENTPGGASGLDAPLARNDEYVIVQGEELIRSAGDGVLANDSPVGLTVTDWDDSDPQRPPSFDGALQGDEDGSFRFSPAPRFFGSYKFTYTAKNQAGIGYGEVTIRVVPVEIELETVLAGLGGYVLYGVDGSNFGASLDRAYDVDQDGKQDLVIGAPAANGGNGAAFLVFGKEELELIQLTLSGSRRSGQRFCAITAGAGERLGTSVSGLGDVDGDGAPDLVLGAPGGNGRAYVVSKLREPSVSLPTATGYVLEGDAANVDVGRVVRGGVDVDGDGVSDVLLGSSNLSYGWIHAIFGSRDSSGRVALRAARGLHLRGQNTDDGFPLALAFAGDLDKDGAAEVLAASNDSIALLRGGGSYPADLGQLTIDGTHGGWLLRRAGSGPVAVAGLGDVNGDGTLDFGYCDGTSYCRVVFGPPTNLASGWTISGFNRKPGLIAMASGGDLDADGLSDVAISDGARAYVIYGRRVGFTDLSVNHLGLGGYSVRAASAGRITSLAVVGDTNGDGIADLALADATADGGSGRVYVVFGVASH